MQLPASVVAEVNARGSADVSPPLPAPERPASSAAQVGSSPGARAGRRPAPGRRAPAGLLAPARLLALLAPALLLGCGYTEFEWQAQLDRSERLQGELARTQQRVRQLEEQTSRGGAAAPAAAEDDRLDAEGMGAGAPRGEPAGARPPSEREGGVLRAFLPLASGDVAVAPRDGRVVISIPHRVLFKGNRDALSPAGEKTLRDMAAIIRANEPLKGLDYQIVVHAAAGAPSVAWRNGWDVAVAQARAVLLFLAQPKEAGLPVARLSLASHADLAPADAGGSAPEQRLEIVVEGTAQIAEGPSGEAARPAGDAARPAGEAARPAGEAARPAGEARPGAGTKGGDETYP